MVGKRSLRAATTPPKLPALTGGGVALRRPYADPMPLPLAQVGGVFAPLELLPLLVVGALYAKRASTLAAKGRPPPVWRQACFASGLLTIAGALVSPGGHIAEELVIAHMVEHLLLGDT